MKPMSWRAEHCLSPKKKAVKDDRPARVRQEEVDELVAAFLAKGGTITVIEDETNEDE